jgi:hypothetical protein
MAYIGPLPAETFTSFATQEFSTSATTSYTLSHPVTNENELALFINNVRQQPGSGKAYTATGTALTLSAATASTDTMYAVFLGRALQTVNPADASVGTSQLAATSVTAAKLNNDIISGTTALAEAPADTDEFLVSDAGTLKRIDYSLIKSNPTHVLLSTATVSSAVAEVDITSNINSTYKVYMIELINVHQATNDSIFRMRAFQGGSVDTGTVYDWVYQRYQQNDINTAEYGQDTDHIKLSYASHNVAEASHNGRFFIYNPSDTTFNTHIKYDLNYQVDGDKVARIDGIARVEETTAVDGVRFYFSAGNIESGIFKLYGVN